MQNRPLPYNSIGLRQQPHGYQGYQGYGGQNAAPKPVQSVAEILSEPLGDIPPDLRGATGVASRQREIADMLTGRVMGKQATGIADGLAQLGEAWIARKANQKADAADSKRDEIISMLTQKAAAGDEASIAQLLSSSPEATVQYALEKSKPQEVKDPFVVNNQVVDRTDPTRVIADYRDPQKPESPEYVYEQIGDEIVAIDKRDPNNRVSVGKAPVRAPMVGVYTGDGGEGSRPIIDKPPKDYQAVWDEEAGTYRMEPIPGSATAREIEQGVIKADARQKLSDQQFTIVQTSIDRAIEQADGWSAGLMAQATQNIGATPARNLRATLDTIVANLGFDKLQEMREMSPTGGALGAVTERELQFLQSVRGSLDQIQSPEQLRATLRDIKQSLSILQEIRRLNTQATVTNSGERVPTGNIDQATDLPPGFEVVQ